jgi:hypothetical protein
MTPRERSVQGSDRKVGWQLGVAACEAGRAANSTWLPNPEVNTPLPSLSGRDAKVDPDGPAECYARPGGLESGIRHQRFTYLSFRPLEHSGIVTGRT